VGRAAVGGAFGPLGVGGGSANCLYEVYMYFE
jgi:hypothetical protein